MIIIEFLIFVISSGLFCSEKFRNHIWAVVVAGVVATGSSILFAYDFGERMLSQGKEPPVVTKIIRETVVKPGQTSKPASVGKSHNCDAEYPTDALKAGEQGITKLAFKILTDGTVDAIQVTSSSGSERLDEAAKKCVANWHYRPAVKDGQIVDADWGTKVVWNLAAAAQAEAQPKPEEVQKNQTETKPEEPVQPKDQPVESTHHWYNIGSWFSSDSEKKPAQQPQPSQP